MVKRDTSKVFFHSLYMRDQAFANAKSCNPPSSYKRIWQQQSVYQDSSQWQVDRNGILWDIIKFFRMILYRRGSENNIVFTGGWIQMMYKAIKGSGNPIREKAACINKDFFLLTRKNIPMTV